MNRKLLIRNSILTLMLGGCVSQPSIELEDPQAIAFVVEGVLSSSVVRTHITEHYMVNGTLPARNADLGLPKPEAFAGNALKTVEVMDGGLVQLTYNSKSGLRNSTIQFVPDISHPAMGIKWRCVTPSFRGIDAWLPTCKYQR